MKTNKIYFSCRKIWEKCFNFGIGVGWDTTDKTFCILIQLGKWLVVLGPHFNNS
jgi:hypothetical protein